MVRMRRRAAMEVVARAMEAVARVEAMAEARVVERAAEREAAAKAEGAKVGAKAEVRVEVAMAVEGKAEVMGAAARGEARAALPRSSLPPEQSPRRPCSQCRACTQR